MAYPRILIAEDDAAMRHLLSTMLRQEGYVIDEVANGIELFARLLGEGFERCDLIIADVRMPGLTGLEVLEALTDSASPPPVILITAFGDEQTHARAKELGAVATLDKPFELDDLIAKVYEVVPPSWCNTM